MSKQTADSGQRHRWASVLAVMVLAAGIVLSQQGCTPAMDRSDRSMVPIASATAAALAPSQSAAAVTMEPSAAVTQTAMVSTAAQVTPAP